jgi:hypothetical protein
MHYNLKFILIFLFAYLTTFLVDETMINTNPLSTKYQFYPELLNNIGVQARTHIEELSLEDNILEAFSFYDLKYNENDKQKVWDTYKTERTLEKFEELLKESHPGKILNQSEWIWNNVGGIHARLKVLYCSTKEYVVLFGTQDFQDGFSGVYPYMDVWDIMLTGEMKSYSAKMRESYPKTYKPGDTSLLKRNESRRYSMQGLSYMIDYGRGSIWRSFWSGIIAPYLFQNYDSHSAYIQIKDCIRSMWQNMSHS